MVPMIRRIVRGYPGRPLRPAPPALDDPSQPANLIVEVGHMDADGFPTTQSLALTRDAALDVIMVIATQLRIGGH